MTRVLLCRTQMRAHILTPPYPALLASAQNRRSTVGTRVAFQLTIKTQSRTLLSLEAGAIIMVFFPAKHKELFSFKMAAVSHCLRQL